MPKIYRQINYSRYKGFKKTPSTLINNTATPAQEQKITKVVNKVMSRKGIRPEVKLFDNSAVIANVPLSTAPFTTLLNNIAQGDTVSSREGNIINLKHLDVRVMLVPKNLPATGGVTGFGSNQECMVGVRMMVVQDKQQVPDDNTFDVTELLASTSADDRTIMSPYTIAQQKRFVVHYDKVRFCEIGKNYHYLRASIPFTKPLQCIYNSTASTDIQKNGLFLVLFYNDFGVPTTGSDVNVGPRFVYYSRCKYTDG